MLGCGPGLGNLFHLADRLLEDNRAHRGSALGATPVARPSRPDLTQQLYDMYGRGELSEVAFGAAAGRPGRAPAQSPTPGTPAGWRGDGDRAAPGAGSPDAVRGGAGGLLPRPGRPGGADGRTGGAGDRQGAGRPRAGD